METPTITKKQLKKTLSGKKKKTDVIKNVLAKPYQNYWPLLSKEDNNHLLETLEKFLPMIVPHKVVIPYTKIKDVPKQERKEFREKFSQKPIVEIKESDKKQLIFGVNDVTKLIENQNAASVLISSQVQPRLLVQHVLDLAVLYSIPALVVENLKDVCKRKCGIAGTVLAFTKSIEINSHLGIIHQAICNINESYPVPADHVNSHRTLDLSTITIADSEDGREEVVGGTEDEVETKNYHLPRAQGHKRAFVPEKIPDAKVVAFINLDASSVELSPLKQGKTEVQYRSLKVKRFKGNKNRTKRKIEKFKRKKTVNTK